jgi:hypothetical protein
VGAEQRRARQRPAPRRWAPALEVPWHGLGWGLGARQAGRRLALSPAARSAAGAPTARRARPLRRPPPFPAPPFPEAHCMSEPTGRMSCPGLAAFLMRTWGWPSGPASFSVSSTCTTASAPSGTGAPGGRPFGGQRWAGGRPGADACGVNPRRLRRAPRPQGLGPLARPGRWHRGPGCPPRPPAGSPMGLAPRLPLASPAAGPSPVVM